MMPGRILQMSTQELIPSPAKRKLLWRTMGKQQFLLLQKPRGDGWGDGTWLQPGAWPGQEGNEVMVSACLNEWLSWCDWCSNAPPPNLFYLALCCSYRGARRTIHRLPGTTGLSERSHWSDLIPEVLPVTQALASWGSAENGVSCLPFHSLLLRQEPEWRQVLRTCYAKTLGQGLWMPSRVRMYPLQLRWAKGSPTLYFTTDLILLPVPFPKHGLQSLSHERNSSFFWLDT